jgi:transposase
MRKGMDGLPVLVQNGFAENAFGGAVFVFRGRRAGLVKIALA